MTGELAVSVVIPTRNRREELRQTLLLLCAVPERANLIPLTFDDADEDFYNTGWHPESWLDKLAPGRDRCGESGSRFLLIDQW